MKKIQNNHAFYEGLSTLGFDAEVESNLYFTEFKDSYANEFRFYIEQAEEFEATAVLLRKQLHDSYKAQVYIFDFTKENQIDEKKIAFIQKKIWTTGDAPIACFFYKTEIKIINCSTHCKDDETPVYLAKTINIVANVHQLFNNQFSNKVLSGIFWEEEELKGKFDFKKSSYDVLIDNIKKTREDLKKDLSAKVDDKFIYRLIVQCILIKYLEERVDRNGGTLFSEKYFRQFDKAKRFTDVLRNRGAIVGLLEKLEKDFNGNIFTWSKEDKTKLQSLSLSVLANALDAYSDEHGQKSFLRYYEFSYIPVELISRLYEEFIAKDKSEKGLFYTPSHLAKLLVDETMPLHIYKKINLDNYTILDPACGSGIFLVIAFKRLIQWWRLQNNFDDPSLDVLKKILENNIHGVDKEEQAIRLTAFSLCLALCDEMQPMQIINKLKFEDLTKLNIVHSDFFTCEKIANKKFDLVIGNPPFSRGAIGEYSDEWDYSGEKVKIPQGQISLKFLAETINNLKESGNLCLIIKSSSLLYNSTSSDYKRLLFSNFNVGQVYDFTAIGRNGVLWDGADVAAAAIFLKNEKPNLKKNILHLTFRRTIATKERVIFEIDDYDFHYLNRQTVLSNDSIWKIDLMGGGRIKSTIEKLNDFENFGDFILNNNCKVGEGYIKGVKDFPNKKYIFQMPTLPTEAIDENGINYSLLTPINKDTKFTQIPNEVIFKAPNVLIWENLGESRIPIFQNKLTFSFKDKIVGIGSLTKDIKPLEIIMNSFAKNNDFYRFHIFCNSSQVLINLNTAILKSDLMKLPFIPNEKEQPIFSIFDKNIIADVNNYMQDFIRHGELSKAVKAIEPKQHKKFIQFIENYGNEFSRVLNLIYEQKKKKFRLSEVVKLCNGAFIATVFKFDSKDKSPVFHNDNSVIKIKELEQHEISKHLSVNRIIKLYPQEDTIIFVKPNQYRYWLSLIAYRDADKCLLDYSKEGY